MTHSLKISAKKTDNETTFFGAPAEAPCSLFLILVTCHKQETTMPPPPRPGNFRARALVRSGARLPLPLRRVSTRSTTSISTSSSSNPLNHRGLTSSRFSMSRVPIGNFAVAAALGGLALGVGVSKCVFHLAFLREAVDEFRVPVPRLTSPPSLSLFLHPGPRPRRLQRVRPKTPARASSARPSAESPTPFLSRTASFSCSRCSRGSA